MKISILASIYAALVVWACKIIGKFQPGSWFYRASRKRLKLWFYSGTFIALALLIFMFTYWGDHGLGDSARIPVGHSCAVEQTNGMLAYLQHSHMPALEIDKFTITDDYLYGTMNRNENYEGGYFIYDLVNNKVETFIQESEFLTSLVSHNLNPEIELKDFNYHYHEYWNGWRFWFLA